MPNDILSVQENFKERIAENLKNQFMELIPEEMLTGLIESTLSDFINGTPYKRQHRDYNPNLDPDTLRGMIFEQIKIIATKDISKVFEGPEWQGIWNYQSNNDGHMGSYVMEAVSEIIGENTDLFVKSLFKGIITNAMSSTINQLRQY